MTDTSAPASRHAWSAVFAMALGAFALVSSEFMPVSLLTPVAENLHVSEGMAGQAISVSGAFALVTSLFISSLTGRLDRRILMLLLTLLMIASGTLVALAPSFGVFLVGRALIGIAIGGFWSMSAAVAMRLVPEHRIPRALAIVNGGNALATVIAAPMGSFFGAIIGWRGAFFCIVPVAVMALIWLFRTLPPLRPVKRQSGGALVLLKKGSVMTGMLAASVFFMGQFTLFTYVRPFLETVTHVETSVISLILLGLGIAGFAGTALIGNVIEKGLFGTLAGLPLAMAAIAVALEFYGSSAMPTGLLLMLWGFFATAAPVAWWTWLARALPDDAEAGGGLLVAICQLAITLGAAIGGTAFDMSGYRATFTLSAVILVLAAALALLTRRVTSRASKEKLSREACESASN